MSKFQFRLTLKAYKSANGSSLVFMLFLMMALVSSGSAVSIEHSYEHIHSMPVMAQQSVSPHAFHEVHSSESVDTHCQHQKMSSEHANLSSNSNVSDVAQLSDANEHNANEVQTTDMPCCKEECNCPADHCFNLSASALIQPSVETEVSVARMAATAPLIGQRISLHFGQFRPPKSLFTA